MNIASYELSADSVKSLVQALSGNEEERIKWLDKFGQWLIYRNRQMEILKWAEQWLKDYAKSTGVYLQIKDWQTDEENLMDWVWYQMEYVGGLCWDKETQSVIVHKYSSSRPLLSEETLVKMLSYITEKIK